MSDRSKGTHFGVLAALLWGSTYVVMRLLYRSSDIDPLWLTFARFVIAGAVLAAVIWARGEQKQLAALARDPLPFFWLGLTGVAAMGMLGAVGSALTTAVNVSLLMNANPIFVAALAPIIGERLTGTRVGGALVGLAGVIVVVLGNSGGGPSFAGARDVWGSLAAVGAAISWALYTLLGKGIVRRYGGLLTTTGAILWGTLLLTVVVGLAPLPTRFPPYAVLLMLYLGLLPSALAFALWYRALALVDAGLLAPTQYLAPPATVLLAWFLLGERVDVAFVVGLVLIFSGIGLASRGE